MSTKTINIGDLSMDGIPCGEPTAEDFEWVRKQATADDMGEGDPASPYYDPFGAERADLCAEIGKLHHALNSVMQWRKRVNLDPSSVMRGLENDPEGIVVALFNGPVWDAAEEALKGK